MNRRVVLKRNPFYRGGRPANVDQMVWTIGETAAGCLTQGRAGPDSTICFGQIFLNRTITRRLAEQYGINRPGGQFFRGPCSDAVSRLQPRPAGVQGAGPDRVEEGDQLRDRPAGARPRVPATSQAHAPTRCCRRRSAATTSIYPLRGADLVTARKWYARAKIKPQTLVFYATNNISFGIGIAEMLQFNLKQIGIELDVKYYDFGTRYEKVGTRGEPFDIAYNNWARRLGRPGRLLRGAPGSQLARDRQYEPLLLRAPVGDREDGGGESLAVGPARRKAWADLDADLMRDDPPWAPISPPFDARRSSRRATAASCTTRLRRRPRGRLQEVALVSRRSGQCPSLAARCRSSAARPSAPSSVAPAAARSRYSTAARVAPACA